MEARIGRARSREIVSGFAHKTILVLGDLMIDEYLRGHARRISQESPVMVIEVEGDDFKPGGAANVGNNLRALGANVVIAGVVGNDEIGRLLRAELAEQGIETSGILTDKQRPTTRKTRIVAHKQQVLRVDREQTNPISPEMVQRLLDHAAGVLDQVDAILVSDYRKGVLTPELAQGLCRLAQERGKPLVTNPKPVSAPWLRGARVLSLNQVEAEELGRSPLPEEEKPLRAFGQRLTQDLGVEMLVITRSEKGMNFWRQDGAYHHVPAVAVEVTDGAGAGDTTISAMTLALVSGATDFEAALLANRAGACVVRKSGVATVSIEELLHSH